MEEQRKKLKHYIAYIRYKGRTHTMPVSGRDEESVIKDVTDFYFDLFEDKKNIIEVSLKEIKRNEK